MEPHTKWSSIEASSLTCMKVGVWGTYDEDGIIRLRDTGKSSIYQNHMSSCGSKFMYALPHGSSNVHLQTACYPLMNI